MYYLTLFVQALFVIVLVSLLIDSRRKKYWKLIVFSVLLIAVTAGYYHLPRKIKFLDASDLLVSYRFVTSPQAKDFYIKQGARFIEEIDSLVLKGRKVPKLVYKLHQ